jgi:hypothetical protein
MRLKLREEAGFSEITEVVGLHRCAIRFESLAISFPPANGETEWEVLRDEDSNSLQPH